MPGLLAVDVSKYLLVKNVEIENEKLTMVTNHYLETMSAKTCI